MNGVKIVASLGAASVLMTLLADKAQAYYDDAWSFVCQWDCGVAEFAPEYGGYTVNGYSTSFFDQLPTSEAEAKDWAYYDYWQAAGCAAFSTTFSQTVCLDTAYLQGVGTWQELASLYWDESDDELACQVIDARAAVRNPDAPYVEGWRNRDTDLAALGGC